MPAGLLGIEELDRAEIEAILARAKDFQPMQSQTLEEARHAARQDDRQPVLRSLHAHAHQLRNRRQAAGRGRGFDHRVGLQRVQGRIAGGHAEHAGGDAAGRHRDAPRGFAARRIFWRATCRPRSSTPATARTSIPRRRCSTRAPFWTAAATLEGLRVAIIGDIAHSRVARSQRAPAFEVRRGDRALRSGVAAAGGTGATRAGRAPDHRHPRGHPRRRRDHDAARATGAAARGGVSRPANISASTGCGWSTWTWPSRTPS